MYNANYIDGVPVKLAEKYKPPPPVYNLPQTLTNKLNLDENFYWNCPLFSCDLLLEKKALSKIVQWKRIRERNKEQRRERIIRREQQRKREDEDKQKNLLYSVSYPSTDDLSSEEEEDNKVGVGAEYEENTKGIPKSKNTSSLIGVTETVNSFHNILQPTVLVSDSSLTVNNSATHTFKSSFENKRSNSFNYKDFEDDTSSPFDNIELKTINDLDVLAQVLHNTQIKFPVEEKLSDNLAVVSCSNSNKSSKTGYPEGEQNRTHARAENIPNPINNLPRFNNHLGNGLSNTTSYFTYHSNQCNQSTNKVDSVNSQTYDRQQPLTDDQITKSKSVPDILKELRDEIRQSEIRRYRNCSYNMEYTSENIDVCLTNESKLKANESDSEDIFSQLDSKAKHLVGQISSMGFPFKRVARIVQLVGTDDKKVVEHLISLSELVDLGFEERKISDALVRNENNKNKALDDLIS